MKQQHIGEYKMLDILRDNMWQGVGGIIAAITLLLYIFVERDKLFRGVTRPTKLTLLLVIIILGVLVTGVLIFLMGAVLGVGAEVITYTLITNLNSPMGIVLAASLLGAGLASFFSILHFILFRNYIRNITLFMLVSLAGITLLGIGMGISQLLTAETREHAAIAIYTWGQGVFTGVIILTFAWFTDKILLHTD
jgi:hypothetical protein